MNAEILIKARKVFVEPVVEVILIQVSIDTRFFIEF